MNRRIGGYDFARSLALFGLVATNFSSGVQIDEFDFIRLYLRALMQHRAIAIFLVLGGVGISLLTQRIRVRNDSHGSSGSRKQLIKRAAGLLVVGICCNLIWHTSLLSLYSIYIIIGALLVTVSNRWLWSLVFVCIATFAVFIFSIDRFPDSYEIPLMEQLGASNPWTVEDIAHHLYQIGFHSRFSWMALLLIGIWLGRQEVRDLKMRRNLFLVGIIVTLVAEGVLCGLIFGIFLLPDSLYLLLSILGGPTGNTLVLCNLFGICGTAITIIGGSLILTAKYPDAKWTKPFIATGQLALTLYVVHLIINSGLLVALGGSEFETFSSAIGSAVIFCICALIFSHFWRKRLERGPLEWGIRRITG